jgi:hypothetical protein
LRSLNFYQKPAEKVLVKKHVSQSHLLVWLTLLVITYLISVPIQAAVMPTVSWIQSISEDISLPTAIAIDSSDNLYVAESIENHVKLLSPYGESKSVLRGLSQPTSIAVGNDGAIYVGSSDKGSVSVYSAELTLLHKLGAGDGEFQKPSDLVVDSTKTAYVVDSKAHKVNIYNPNGSLKLSFGIEGKASGQFTTPIAIALNEAEAEIIVSDLAMVSPWTPSSRIQVFDLNGNYKRHFYNIIDGFGYLRPFAVSVDKLNRIYVADAFQSSIAVFDLNGIHLGQISDPVHPFRTPVGLSYSATKDRMFVASVSAARIDAVAIDNFDPALDIRGEDGLSLNNNYDFGTVWINKSAGPKKITVTNDGNSDLAISQLQLSNNATSEFSIVSGSDNCSGQTLAPLTSCSVDIDFSPISEGSKIASLEIISNATGSAVTSATLQGISIVTPQFAIAVVNVSDGGTGTVQGTGINCGSDCLEQYDSGSVVTLTAVADDGSVFTGWSGAGCRGTGECSIDVSEALTVTATFSAAEIPTYFITASAGANGSISPTDLLVADEGTDQIYTITPYSGYQVKTLFVDGAAVASANSYTFSNITAHHRIDVEFEEQPVAAPLSFESGMVTEAGRWIPVAFNSEFTAPIVVVSPINNDSAVTPNIQLRNITAFGFELFISEHRATPNVQSRTHAAPVKGRMGGMAQISDVIRGKSADIENNRKEEQRETVAAKSTGSIGHSVRASYLVVEEGTHQLFNGETIEARKVAATQGAASSQTLFGSLFSTPPVVLATVTNSISEDNFSVAINSVTLDGFNQQLTGSTPGQVEELSYIAWEPSTGIRNGMHFEVNLIEVNGNGVNKEVQYLNHHLHNPVILGGLQTTNGIRTQAPVWQFETMDNAEVRLGTEAQEVIGFMVFSLGTVHPEMDSDNDGLNDLVEVSQTGTNPILSDTDGDGMNDGEELAYWGPLSDVDSDDDTVINLLDFDSDGDTFSDGVEVEANSDPINKNSTP